MNTRQVRTIQQIFLHPEYNSSTTDHNIAVFCRYLIYITKYIQPVCLPDDEKEFIDILWQLAGAKKY
jgi:hypothetical protein